MIVSSVLLSFVDAKAQEDKAVVTVNGTVTDQGGFPLQGVSVAIKNAATKAVVSDEQGNFSIQARIGDILAFTHVGYQIDAVTVTGKQSNLDVSLELSLNSMEEVVVIGYGSVKRKNLTSSVSSIDASDMVKSTAMSLTGTMQGKAAGVSVISPGGAPGAGFRMYIRAGSSISASNDPLYVIDGFPYLGGSNLNINVNDIKSVEILKDASATAIYGSRGANGVVIITTKTGKAGKFRINYDGYYTLQQLGEKRDVLNALQFAKLQHYQATSPTNSELGDPIFYNWPTYKDSATIDWQDLVYRVAPMHSHNLSFTGGAERVRMAGSLNYTDQDGIAVGTNYKRYSARLNGIAEISKAITNQTTIALTFQDRTGPSMAGAGGYVYSAVKASPYLPPNMNMNEYVTAHGYPPGGETGRDPMVDLLNSDVKLLGYYAGINSSLSFKLMEGLTLKVAGGISYKTFNNNYFYGSNTSHGKFQNGVGRKNSSISIGLINENTLNYSTSFGGGHELDALVGFSVQKETNTSTAARSWDYPIQALGYHNLGYGTQFVAPSSGKAVSGMESYFGRVQYAFRDKYLFTGTFRADGSSKFPVNKWGYFPSAGFAWRVDEEKFMSKIPAISALKLRVTYGLTGNESISPYSSYTYYGNAPIDPVINNQSVIGVTPAQLGSTDLKWETTIQQNLGLDLGLFDNRIFLTADAYIKKSRDLLLAAPVPNYSGFTSVIRNVGDIQVKGLEFALNTVNLNGKFKWTTNFNIAFNQSKVLSLNENQEYFYTGEVSRFGYVFIVRVGEELGSIYGFEYDGIINTQEELSVTPRHTTLTYAVGTRKYKDVNGPDGKGLPDGVVNSLDQTVIGNGNPDFFGGFTNNLSYGPFELSFMFTYTYGNDIINADRAWVEMARPFLGGLTSMLTRWTPKTPRINSQRTGLDYNNEYNYISSYLVEDGSYLRLKNIQVAYNFGENLLRKLPIKSCRVYFTAQNLLTFTNYSGYDPEVNYLQSIITPGVDQGAYPRSKLYTFGLNLGF